MDQRRDLVNGMADDPEVLRQRAQEQLDQIDEMLAERQREREQSLHAPQGSAVEPAWTPPTLGPAQPVHRAVAPRERPPPAPPMPDKFTRVQHDGSGRITATESYSGAGAAAARSWEQFIRQAVDVKAREIIEGEIVPLGTLLGQVCGDLGKRLVALETVVAELRAEREQRPGDRQRREEFDVAAD